MNAPAIDAAARARSAKAARHSAARLAAVQALYQAEISGASIDRVVEEFLRYRLGKTLDGPADAIPVAPNEGVFAELVRGFARRSAEIDELLGAVLPSSWPLARLEAVLRAILRLGAFELVARRQVPVRSVITEYLDIAHAFYGGAEPGMVNGVLDRLAHSLRPDELAAGPGRAGPDDDGSA
jgi:transcription antitermination protein NusB